MNRLSRSVSPELKVYGPGKPPQIRNDQVIPFTGGLFFLCCRWRARQTHLQRPDSDGTGEGDEGGERGRDDGRVRGEGEGGVEEVGSEGREREIEVLMGKEKE